MMSKVVEKSVEYDKTRFSCLVDLKKAFYRIPLKYVIQLLLCNRVLPNILIITTQNIYYQNNVKTRLNVIMFTTTTPEKPLSFCHSNSFLYKLLKVSNHANRNVLDQSTLSSLHHIVNSVPPHKQPRILNMWKGIVNCQNHSNS